MAQEQNQNRHRTHSIPLAFLPLWRRASHRRANDGLRGVRSTTFFPSLSLLLLFASSCLTAHAFLPLPCRFKFALAAVPGHRRGLLSGALNDVTGEMASTSAKGAVTLGPYKNGALSFTYPKPTVSDAEVEAQVKTAAKKTFKLTPVRFVEEGGTRMGHTVVCDWKATYVSGGDPAKHSLRPGAVLPRADIKNFVLELKEDQSEPLASFARAVASGMGQMETKVFEVAMPESATIESWRGVTAKIMLLVRSINIKENLAADGRSIEEKQAAVRAELQAKTDAAARQEAIAHFRAILLETTQTETEKMQESVSWAKFGENSLKDFKWSLIQEAIATAEGIDFSEVPSFLLRENPVVWT